jgi:hypothetical protein
MDMQTLKGELLALNPNEHRVVYTSPGGVLTTVKHTARFSPKDFAVGIWGPGASEFYPTHVRLLIDLYIKRSSNSAHAHDLYLAFERIFQADDPNSLLAQVQPLTFSMTFDEPIVNLCYAQLLMIEQDINYGPGGAKQSKLNPPREYLMRFVRWTADSSAQIDRIITAAVRSYPAPPKYAAAIV